MRAGDSISALTKSELFYEECKYVLTGIDFIKFKSRYPRGVKISSFPTLFPDLLIPPLFSLLTL